tara:strand:+ start:317 stop:706 length:390 start_codon:yes stop_codon:yes gene_type:complete
MVEETQEIEEYRYLFILSPRAKNPLVDKNIEMELVAELFEEKGERLKSVFLDARNKSDSFARKYCGKKDIQTQDTADPLDFIQKLTNFEGKDGVFAYITERGDSYLTEIAKMTSKRGIKTESRTRYFPA